MVQLYRIITGSFPQAGFSFSAKGYRFEKQVRSSLMHRIFLSCFFITLCFISATTNAQHYQINDTILLPDVEIEGVAVFEKNAAFQRQMDTLSMQSMQSAGLTTLLSQHSGVFVKNSGPGTLSTVSFRGTAASHTLVLWNDFPVNAPMLGQVDFSQVPVFFIDQVGVLWGSASSAKRAGGLGGTVTLDNTMKLNKGLHLDLCQTAGSYGTFGSYATVDISKKKFQFRTRFFRKASRNDFEYENTASLPNARMKQQNADYSDYGLMQEIHISNRFGNFSLISWNQWNSRKLPPIMTNLERGGKPEEFQDDQFHRNVLGYLNAWQSGKIEIKAGYFIENQRYFLRTTSASAPAETVTLIDSKNKLESMHGQMKVTQSLLKNLSLFGRMQWNRDKVVSNNYSDTKTRTQSSISMGATWVVNSFLSTELIVNQDMADNNNLGLNPSFTVYYKIPSRQTLNISGGINKNYRLPSMNDLFWYPGGNESLQAEKGITTDLSIQWQPRAGNFHSEMDIDVFFSVISDWIQWRPTEYRYWEPLNIARVFARGTEFHFRTEGKVYGTSISLSGNYVFTITTDESQVAKLENSSGRQLIYIPRHHANMSLSSAYKGYSFTYTIEFTGRRTTSPNGEDLYTGVLPAYVLHHIALGKKIKKFESEIRVNNLLNKSYQAVLWRAMPGRNAEILIRYQL